MRELINLPDDKGHLPGPLVTPNPYLKYADTTVVPELYDIPIGIVNRVLYGPKINVIHGLDKYGEINAEQYSVSNCHSG
ncbi:hypothetical protein J3R82DRAFT_7215 [Butyriboletus roseoflavus]|nr:hypothetical protein J3R82DRAFT_7215 [Butyriboletus roseoflavus]